MSLDLPSLLARALAARVQAYAPYSHYLVGAALLTTSREIFSGCNVENVSFGLTNCAERVALQSAVSAGERSFVALAIAGKQGITPCGACLQVLSEFCGELPIYLIDADAPEQVVETSLAALLPGAFKAQLFEP